MREYRPNVAALMVNEKGELLVCERLLNPGAWQFPQGGVDDGEEPSVAILREIEEEIGLKAEHYVVVKWQDGYRYDYPEGVRKKKSPEKARFIGQEQRYYLCRVNSDAPEVNLMQEPREFSKARWIEPKEFRLSWLPDFKKETYKAVMNDFFAVALE